MARSGGALEELLLRLARLSSQSKDLPPVVSAFCRELLQHFGASGVFCWGIEGSDLVGLAAEGIYARHFEGVRIPLSKPSLATDAVSQQRTIFLDNFQLGLPSFAEDHPVRSAVAAPLVAFGRSVGAVVLVHDNKQRTSQQETRDQLTLLTTPIAQFIDTLRLSAQSLEERRRSELLVECSQNFNAQLGIDVICRGLCERLRQLLNAETALILRLREADTQLLCISSEKQGLATDIQQCHESKKCSEAAELAQQAMLEDAPFSVELQSSSLAGAFGEGQLLVAPLKFSGRGGAVLLHVRLGVELDDAAICALQAMCGFGAIAISNAELLQQSETKASEVQQLLEISSALGTISELDKFLEQFVVRAAEFLGFQRSFIAIAEAADCTVRWVAEGNVASPFVVKMPDCVMDAMRRKEVFWSDDGRTVPGVDLAFIEEHNLQQGIAAPLLGSDGRLLGALGVLDRHDGQPISPEDLRRAKALAAEVAVVLEATQNLALSNQHRKRAEDLMELALELSSSLRLPDLVECFTRRAASMLGARAGALVLARGSSVEVVFLHEPEVAHDQTLLRRLSLGLSQVAARQSRPVISSTAAELLGPENVFGWHDLTVARLMGSDDELLGLLCLADRKVALAPADESLIQAIVGHASVALENSRMFSRLSQASRHWVEIFDAISDLIVVHDESHKILRVNRSMADFVGTRPQEVIGVSMRALMAISSDATGVCCPFCRTHASAADEYVHPLMDRTYLISTSRIQGMNEGMQTIHVLKDITDRREAERRYRELFDNIQEGLFFSTPEGRFVEVNDALVRMLGYGSREELLQVDIPQALYLDADNRGQFSSAIEKAGTLRNFEEVLRRKDGSLIYTLQNAFAVRNGQGRVVQYRGLILDITDQKNFQTELQRQRDFNLKILNNTQSLILVLDTAGLISYGNRRCYEAGCYAQEELMGRPMAELIPPNRRQLFLDALYATVTGQQVDNLDLSIQRGDGRIGQFSINMSPMRDEQGNVTSIVVVMTDITDAAVLQAKLMNTEKLAAVGQLVSGVAHEVNNPLTAILGFADLMACDHGLPETARRDLGVIIQEAQRTKQIVQNLLSFARQMPPQRQPVQLNTILRRTLQLRSYDFANHGVQIVEHFQEGLPEVVGDAHQLQQVFLNIINNAYDSVMEMARAGHIEILSRFRDGSVEVQFVDNGSGISVPDRIFDPFFTTKEVGKGTGLGLSICYGIVREHGGEITCHNNVGKTGATFIVRLPALQPEIVTPRAAAQGVS